MTDCPSCVSLIDGACMKSKTLGDSVLVASSITSPMAESARRCLLVGGFAESLLLRRSKELCVIVEPLPPELPELPVIVDSTDNRDGFILKPDSCLLCRPNDLCLAAHRWLMELFSPCLLLLVLSFCLCFRPDSGALVV